MLPENIKTILAEVVVHKTREHTRERNNEVREFTFKMARQGLSQSSAFIKGKTDIYCEASDKYAADVWNEIQRVLNSNGFEYYEGCQDDLINFLKTSLTTCGDLDKRSLFDNKESNQTGIQAHSGGRFIFRHEAAIGKMVTEVKIFTNKLRTTPKKDVPNVPVNVGIVNQIHVSGAGAGESKKWSVQTWCAVIAVILTAIGLIGGAIWKVYTLPKATTLPPAIDVKYDTALAKDYDNKFENMTKRRALAAIAVQEYLSKGKWELVTNNTDALDDVLSFFDPMGYDEERGLLSPATLHEYFCDDIMSYYQVSQDYIANLQKKEGPTTFEHIKPLFETVRKIEAEKSPKINFTQVFFTKDELWKYFQSETNSVNLKDGK